MFFNYYYYCGGKDVNCAALPEAAEKAKAAEAESAAKNPPAPVPPATSANPPPSAVHDAQIRRLPSSVLDAAKLLRAANEATVISSDGH